MTVERFAVQWLLGDDPGRYYLTDDTLRTIWVTRLDASAPLTWGQVQRLTRHWRPGSFRVIERTAAPSVDAPLPA